MPSSHRSAPTSRPPASGSSTKILKLARGHQDQILMSHDIAYKSSLTKYGGYGYHHCS